MSNAASANETPLVSREHAGNVINEAIRLFVGRGRRYSVKQLSNGTGVKDRVIECAMCDAVSLDYRPLPLEALISISGFLGPEFTTEWLKLAQQGAFWLPESGGDSPARMAIDLADDAAAVVRAGMDDHFDAEERKTLRPVGRHLIAVGAALAVAEQAA